MKRWAICRMGEWDEPGEILPRVALYAKKYRALSVDGLAWALAQFSVNDLTAVNADDMIRLIPDVTLDAAWSTIPSNVRTQVRTAMQNAGFVWAPNNSWTVRRVINYCAEQIQSGVDFTQGDVQDI